MFDEIEVTMDNDGDLITRAEAVKAALDWNVRPHEDVFDAIKSAIAVRMHAVPKAEGWFSVKDRLPELGQEVLVYAVGKIDGFIGEHVYALSNRFVQRLFPSSPGYEMWSSPWEYFHTDYDITHWMPLPEPPEEEQDEETD